MELLEGLFFFEIVLLVLGAFLFFVLVFLLIYIVIKNQPAKYVVFLFPLPIVMIGFPGIQKVRFENGIVEIERRVQQLAENPGDASTRQELAKAVAEIEHRPVSDPKTRVTLAEAQMAIGDTAAAVTYLESALKAKPELAETPHLKETFVSAKTWQVKNKVAQLQHNPDNPQVRKDLQQDLQDIEKFSSPNAAKFQTILEGYQAIGDTTKVKIYADSLRKYNPNLLRSIQLDLRKKQR